MSVKIFFKHLKNQAGLTIAEVLIMLGVSSVFVMGLAELAKSITVASRTQNIESQIAQLENEVDTILNDPELCKATFSGQPPVGNIVFNAPNNNIVLNSQYRDLFIRGITSEASGTDYILKINYDKKDLASDTRTIMGPTQGVLQFNYTAGLTGGLIDTCKGSSDQKACEQLGGKWSTPVANSCNFDSIDAETCTNLGGTWVDPVCALTTANKNSCEALGGTWASDRCNISIELQDGKRFCEQLSGGMGWVYDPDISAFKCDFTKLFKGDCAAANADLVPDGSGKCMFQPATADACNAIRGVWLMTPYPHCELNLNPVPICTSTLGCTWDGTKCACAAPAVTPPPPVTPVPSSCTLVQIANYDAFKSNYEYAFEFLLKTQEVNACVDSPEPCDADYMVPPPPGWCNPATSGQTYSYYRDGGCTNFNCILQARYRCDCPVPPPTSCECWRMTCNALVSGYAPLSDYPTQPICNISARDACPFGAAGCSKTYCNVTNLGGGCYNQPTYCFFNARSCSGEVNDLTFTSPTLAACESRRSSYLTCNANYRAVTNCICE